jgi:hypothetical protein
MIAHVYVTRELCYKVQNPARHTLLVTVNHQVDLQKETNGPTRSAAENKAPHRLVFLLSQGGITKENAERKPTLSQRSCTPSMLVIDQRGCI